MDKLDGWLLFTISVSGALLAVMALHKAKGNEKKIDNYIKRSVNMRKIKGEAKSYIIGGLEVCATDGEVMLGNESIGTDYSTLNKYEGIQLINILSGFIIEGI